MVYFIADAESIRAATARISMDYQGLESCVRFVEYSQLLSLGSLPAGTYVFTGTMLFEEGQRRLATLVEKELQSRPDRFRVLNSPFRGKAARATFERLFTGEFLPKVKASDFDRDSDFDDRFNTESNGQSIDDESFDDEWSFIAGLILDGSEPDRQAVSPPIWPMARAFLYSDTCVNLGTDYPLTPQFTGRFGLDVFAINYSAEPEGRKLSAMSDSLLNLLPSTGGETPVARAITEAIIKLDTITHSEPVSIRVGWESMARALELKSAS
jgi:hypothetical protein